MTEDNLEIDVSFSDAFMEGYLAGFMAAYAQHGGFDDAVPASPED